MIFCNFLSKYLQNKSKYDIIIDIKADFVEILDFLIAKSTQKRFFYERKENHVTVCSECIGRSN